MKIEVSFEQSYIGNAQDCGIYTSTRKCRNLCDLLR